MFFLKMFFYFFVCGSYAFSKRQYCKSFFLIFSFLSSFYALFVGIYSEGLRIFIWIFFAFFFFFFSVIYNFLDICTDKTIALRRSFLREEDRDLYKKAIVFYLQDKMDEALDLFMAMKKRNKHDADLYFQMGKIYYKKGMLKKSKRMLRKYLSFEGGKKWKRLAIQYLSKS